MILNVAHILKELPVKSEEPVALLKFHNLMDANAKTNLRSAPYDPRFPMQNQYSYVF